MSHRCGLPSLKATAFAFLCLLGAGESASAANSLTGWNVAGAEFGSLPGRHGHEYIYPSASDLDALAAKGMNVLRLPFRWERIQPKLHGDLSAAELALLQEAVAAARGRNLAVVLDVHNYARFDDKPIGSPEVPEDALADLWRRLAVPFRDDPHILFGLMNEPHDMSTQTWLRAANLAIRAIRDAGAHNLVLVPGNAWTGAHSWSSGGEGSNATVMAGVEDPCGNVAYEVHQYFDADYSGTSPLCVGQEGALKGLRSFTEWLRGRRARGFLGEFGTGSAASCAGPLRSALSVMADNPDVWIGWTAWAAGAWWAGDYPLSLQKRDGRDKPQVTILADFAARKPPPALSACRSR